MMMDTSDREVRKKVPLTLHHHSKLNHYWYLPPLFHSPENHYHTTLSTTSFGVGIMVINSAPLLVKSHYESRICYTTEK